jgi:hypothetical protein
VFCCWTADLTVQTHTTINLLACEPMLNLTCSGVQNFTSLHDSTNLSISLKPYFLFAAKDRVMDAKFAPELWQMVGGLVKSEGDLPSISKASKYMFKSLIPVLYRSVCLSRNIDSTLATFKLFKSNPTLAHNIHDLELCGTTCFSGIPNGILVAAILNMTSLKSITIGDGTHFANLAHIKLENAQILELSQHSIAPITKVTWKSPGFVRIPDSSTEGESRFRYVSCVDSWH